MSDAEPRLSDADLARLRRDLDLMEEAAGMSQPFGWRDVWLSLGLVPCGLVILLWAAFGPWDYVAVSLVPLGLLSLVAGGIQAVQYQRGGKNRSVRHEALASALVALAFAVLIAWEKWLSLPAMPVRGAAFIIAGVLCLAAATVSLVPFGISLPLCSPQQVAMVGGVAVAVAGVVAAGIVAGQLRAAKQA